MAKMTDAFNEARAMGGYLSTARSHAKQILVDKYWEEYEAAIAEEMKAAGYSPVEVTKMTWKLNGK